MFDESNISSETHKTILSKFPCKYKSSISDLLVNEQSIHDQLFVIYYDRNHNNVMFSFEHLCRTINEITDIPINKIIKRYRRTSEWSLLEIRDKKLEFIVEKLLQ